MIFPSERSFASHFASPATPLEAQRPVKHVTGLWHLPPPPPFDLISAARLRVLRLFRKRKFHPCLQSLIPVSKAMLPYRPLMVQEAEAQAVAPGDVVAKPGPAGTGAPQVTGCPGCGAVASHRYDSEDEEKAADPVVTSG